MQNVLKSKMFIGALAAVAAVAAAVVIALNVGHSGNDLQTQLDLGNKYVSELDYENAIIAYEEALEIDPYCLEAYLGLYDAYLALGQQDKAIEIMEQAKNMLPDSVEVYVSLAQLYASQNQIGLVVSTLEEGIEVTNSDRLREMLREYQYEPGDGQMERAENSLANGQEGEEEEEEEQPPQEMEETSVAIGLRPDRQQQTVIPVLMVSREDDGLVEIPLVTPPVQNNNAGESSGSSSGGNQGGGSSSGGTAVTRTGISGNIYDINGQGIGGVTITLYPNQEMEPIEVSTNAIGGYLQELPEGSYRVILSKEGYVELSTSVTVSRDNLASGSYIMLTEEESRQSASLKGIVIDATDSKGIEDARMVFMKGFDQNPDENPDALLGSTHAFTGNDGHFSVPSGMTAGYYTFQVTKDGYSTYHHNETVKPGENDFTINMSPTIQAQGIYRIVLTWGAFPSDLDSHLVCTGNDNYHVYFGNKNSSDGNASLDWDDVTSYGPETITVKIGEGNSYIYAVHNFSNGGAAPGQSSAWNLSSSGAKVMVYADEGLVFDGNVPANEQGITWEVFRIENGRLVVTNKVNFDYPGTAAGGRSADAPAALSDEAGKGDVSDENEIGPCISNGIAETETAAGLEEQPGGEAIDPGQTEDTLGADKTGDAENTASGDTSELEEAAEPQDEGEGVKPEEAEVGENTETEIAESANTEEVSMEGEPQPEETTSMEGEPQPEENTSMEGEPQPGETTSMEGESQPEENNAEEKIESKTDEVKGDSEIQNAGADEGTIFQEPQEEAAQNPAAGNGASSL